MSIKIYHNQRCSKSRCTLQLIEDKGITAEIINYLESPPSEAELDAILTLLGKEPWEIVRKGEQVYKDLGLPSFEHDRSEWIKKMVENPILIERPIVVNGDKACLGRPPENVHEIL